jgi:hypothetical protein
VSTPPIAAWRPTTFTLQRSDDGCEWTDVDTVTANHEDRCERRVPAFTARYVRLFMPHGKPFSVNELELYRRGDGK